MAWSLIKMMNGCNSMNVLLSRVNRCMATRFLWARRTCKIFIRGRVWVEEGKTEAPTRAISIPSPFVARIWSLPLYYSWRVNFSSSLVIWSVTVESKYQLALALVEDEAAAVKWLLGTYSSLNLHQHMLAVQSGLRQTWQRGCDCPPGWSWDGARWELLA
jgi:hypothetical protein